MKTLLNEEFLTENEYCEFAGITVSTARSNAARRTGPPRIRVGRRIFYRKSAVLAWLLEHERQPRPPDTRQRPIHRGHGEIRKPSNV